MNKKLPKSIKMPNKKTIKKLVKRNVKSSKAKTGKLSKISRLNPKVIALAFIVLFAGVGSYYLMQSRADAPVRLEKFVNNKEKGLFWDDLEEGPAQGPCKGLLVPKNPTHKKDNHGKEVCTHGPDPAPEGIDVRDSVEPIRTGENDETALARPGVAYAQTAPTSSLPCEGDGQSGNRVQFLYVHASDQPNRYSSFAQSFQVWAANADASFADSAAQTGGVRHLRIVTDANCRAVIPSVTLSSSGDDSWSNTWAELQAKGYNRTDRKYSIFVDAQVYCGIGDIRSDDQPGAGNANNYGPSFARVDSGCWGNPLAVAHELMHTLGGVQQSAPHKTAGWHCTDDYDLMCYNDTSMFAGDAQIICSDRAKNRLFDCNKDDYFSTAPPAGSYLATRWNTANNVFLTTNNNLVALPPHPTGCTPDPNYALIYSETNFGGNCKTLAVGYGYPNQADLQPVPHVGSAKVGANVKLTLCWSANYAPVCDTYSADAPTLVHPFSSVSALVGLRSGEGDTAPPPPPPSSSDTTIPTVAISQPTGGTVIRNSTPITASAADNVGVTQMQIYVDGQLKATSTTGSISYNWNSKKASRGTHTILVKARDAAGNIGQASVSITK